MSDDKTTQAEHNETRLVSDLYGCLARAEGGHSLNVSTYWQNVLNNPAFWRVLIELVKPEEVKHG